MQPQTKKLSIIVMDDTGKTRRYRCQTWLVQALCGLILILPIVTALVIWLSVEAWQATHLWQQEKISLEQALNKSTMQLQSLKHLQALLSSKSQPSLIKQAAPASTKKTQKPKPKEVAKVSKKVVKKTIEAYKKPIRDIRFRLDNVQVRLANKNRLRIKVDLFNADSSKILSGTLTFSLLYPDGAIQTLKTEDSTFRIRRYKKVLDSTLLDKKALQNITKCLLIAEIHMDGLLTFRSYYPIEVQ